MKLHRVDPADWAYMQSVGLHPDVRSPQDYLRRVQVGAARAETLFLASRQVIPSQTMLCVLHRTMFRDVCPTAGTIRQPGQEVQAGTLDCVSAVDIPTELRNLNRRMLAGGLEGSRQYKAQVLAFYHAAFVAIHPFRDGNGRLGRLILDVQSRKLLNREIDFSPLQRHRYIETLATTYADGEVGVLADLILTHSLPLQRRRSRTISLTE